MVPSPRTMVPQIPRSDRPVAEPVRHRNGALEDLNSICPLAVDRRCGAWGTPETAPTSPVRRSPGPEAATRGRLWSLDATSSSPSRAPWTCTVRPGASTGTVAGIWLRGRLRRCHVTNARSASPPSGPALSTTTACHVARRWDRRPLRGPAEPAWSSGLEIANRLPVAWRFRPASSPGCAVGAFDAARRQ